MTIDRYFPAFSNDNQNFHNSIKTHPQIIMVDTDYLVESSQSNTISSEEQKDRRTTGHKTTSSRSSGRRTGDKRAKTSTRKYRSRRGGKCSRKDSEMKAMFNSMGSEPSQWGNRRGPSLVENEEWFDCHDEEWFDEGIVIFSGPSLADCVALATLQQDTTNLSTFQGYDQEVATMMDCPQVLVEKVDHQKPWYKKQKYQFGLIGLLVMVSIGVALGVVLGGKQDLPSASPESETTQLFSVENAQDTLAESEELYSFEYSAERIEPGS